MTRTVLLLLTLTLALSAKDKDKGKDKIKPHKEGGGQQSAYANNVSVSVIFGDSDRRMIEQWAHAMPASGLPPGLAKHGQLPPGLQKHLRRNGTLPPGLQKKLTYFPADLNNRLGPLPPNCNCDRVFYDGKAMIIARAVGAILDVISIF